MGREGLLTRSSRSSQQAHVDQTWIRNRPTPRAVVRHCRPLSNKILADFSLTPQAPGALPVGSTFKTGADSQLFSHLCCHPLGLLLPTVTPSGYLRAARVSKSERFPPLLKNLPWLPYQNRRKDHWPTGPDLATPVPLSLQPPYALSVLPTILLQAQWLPH